MSEWKRLPALPLGSSLLEEAPTVLTVAPPPAGSPAIVDFGSGAEKPLKLQVGSPPGSSQMSGRS